MKKNLLVINPTSNNARARRRWPLFKSKIMEQIGDMNLRFCKNDTEASYIIEEASQKKIEKIIIFGCDSTVFFLINACLSEHKSYKPKFSIIPSSRLNHDLFYSLNPNWKGDKLETVIEKSLAQIKKGRARKIDLGVAQFEAHKKYFTSLASFGLSEKILSSLSNSKLDFHLGLSVMNSCVDIVRNSNSPEISLFNGRKKVIHSQKLFNCYISNGIYGNGLELSPKAKLTDGKLHALAIEHRNISELMMDLPTLWLEGAEDLQSATYISGKQFTIDSENIYSQTKLTLDGVHAGQLPVKFSISPKAASFL